MFHRLATTERLDAVFGDEAWLAAMLRFEVSLARVQARLGLIPEAAARAIAAAADPAAFDAAAIVRDMRRCGTPAIPMVTALIERVNATAPDAAASVHFGATSQDVTDSATSLCLRQAAPVLEADCERLRTALRRLSDEHATTIMLARTLLQPAVPTTFGLKCAGWYAMAVRTWRPLAIALESAAVLQFGGAAGTLAALGPNGPRVAAALADELGLPAAGAPWHAQRDRLAAFVTACGVHTGALGKIARDLTLLMQFEVGEAFEPGGGSSAMPHKRNPAACATVLAAATRVPGLVASFLSGMVQEHERGVGTWHAEGETIVDVVRATGAAVQTLAAAMSNLQVDPLRMRRNLDATGGAIFAERAMTLLGPRLGRSVAREIVETALVAARSGNATFPDAVRADRRVAAAAFALDDLGDPAACLGAAETFRRRLLDT